MKPINYDKLSNVGTTNYNIRRGASGDNVRQLQTKLSNMGYNIGTSGADGKFGKNTAAAVRQFQKDYNLQVDGIVGDQTMSALSQIRSTPIKPQVGGTGATAMGNIGDSTRGTNLDARDAANMAVASTPKNISYGDTMGVTTKPSIPAPVTTKLPPVPPRTNIT
jgi:peptidoglycan hydrolase-like protein with peptidoglycan-binding domain